MASEKPKRHPRLAEVENPLGVLVHHVRDAYRRHHLEEIGRDALEEATDTLLAHRLARTVNDARVRVRMQYGSLRLEAGAEQVDRVDD